ncbi:hypothetical protein ACE1CD_08485 [Aerosakkonema sp. BLCC-F183]|uniref:hypothetical protein n=1 Tax=Aerosakkonema sp. BLCC-F183 TaxID=3342834 RepID=UPI0035B73E1F
MSIHIDDEKFEIAHNLFKESLLKDSKGVTFENFQHPFLVKDEIEYKWKAYREGRKALCLDNWRQWLPEQGKIIEATKNACNRSVNLLEHKYGFQNSPEAALYKVNEPAQIEGLEKQLFDFFIGGASIPSEFGHRFDALADYLRINKLPCSWPFLAYLAFLLDPLTYFPVIPKKFDKLLKFYGIEKSISKSIYWEKYCILLELAEVLKSKLTAYGNYGEPNAIEIHSYMWVVSYSISTEEDSQSE